MLSLCENEAKYLARVAIERATGKDAKNVESEAMRKVEGAAVDAFNAGMDAFKRRNEIAADVSRAIRGVVANIGQETVEPKPSPEEIAPQTKTPESSSSKGTEHEPTGDTNEGQHPDSIYNLDLPEATIHLLTSNQVNTITQARNLVESGEIADLKGVGIKKIAEIRQALGAPTDPESEQEDNA